MPEQKDEQFERFEQWARQYPEVQEIINKTNRRLDILNLATQLIRVVMILGFVGAGFYADHYYNTFPIFTVIGSFAMVGVYFQKQESTLREVYQQLVEKRRHPVRDVWRLELTGKEWLSWPLEKKRALVAEHVSIALMGIGHKTKFRPEEVPLGHITSINETAAKHPDDPRFNTFIANFINEMMRLSVEHVRKQVEK
jgi:hypothetical protein